MSAPATHVRGEGGFTLMELVVAMAVATVVFSSAFTLVNQAMPATRRITARMDAQERARLAVEQMERSIGSSVCVPNGVDAAGNLIYRSPITSTSNDTQVSFYAENPTGTAIATDANNSQFAPQLRQLVYANGTIVEKTWAGTGTWPSYSFPSLTSTRTVVSGVSPPASGRVFTYEAYDPTTGVLGPLAAGTVAGADLPRIARVDFSFSVASKDSAGNGAPSSQDTAVSDQVSIALPIDFTSNATMAEGPDCTP